MIDFDKKIITEIVLSEENLEQKQEYTFKSFKKNYEQFNINLQRMSAQYKQMLDSKEFLDQINAALQPATLEKVITNA